MTRTLFLFALAATALLARHSSGQDLTETKWTVAEDGSVLVTPHPGNTVKENREGVSRPLFDLQRSLGEVLVGGGALTWLRLLLPGPRDLASHCDIEHHFRRLGLGLTDEEIVRRVATPAEEVAQSGPLRRRAELDRLLAVRLAGDRKLAEAGPALLGIHRSRDSDPFLRDAAWEALAELGEPPLPYPVRDVPPLLPVLAEIPESADLVVVINQGRVPSWKGMAAAARELAIREARRLVVQLGAAVTELDLAAGQVSIDRAAETPYEIARRLGNMRIDRTVAAIDMDDGLKIRLRMDGRFEPVKIQEVIEALGGPVESTEDLTIVRITDAKVYIEVSKAHLFATFGDWRGKAGGPLLATELGLAGAARGEAVWAHLRNPAPPGKGPPLLQGLTRGTVVMSFAKGIRWHLEGEYVREAASRVVAASIREILARAPPPLCTTDPDIVREGPVLRLDLALPGASPEDALLRLMKLR